MLHKLGSTDLLRFEREAEVLASLAHPHIVRYVAHGHTADRPFLAMEWIDGVTLAERLGQGALGVVDAAAVVSAVADALAFAHARGVVHRDVKPSNVVLAGGRIEGAKLVDFGLARRGAGRRPRSR